MISSRRSTVRRGFGALVVLPLLVASAFAGSKPVAALAPSDMLAQHYSSMGPMELAGVSIKNFGVVDGRIYRGGQPKADDYRALKAIGVATIVDLRDDFDKSSRANAEAAGLKYVNIPVVDHAKPTDEQAAEFIKLLDDPSTGVAYVHCAGGRHRTGSMIAIYRMVRDGWTVDQAYKEMLDFDFYTSNGHGGFKDYVFDYYQRMTANPQSVPVAYVTGASAATATAVR